MRQKIICTLIGLACVLGVSAQSFTLVGRVTDEKMNPVELASVACVEQGRATLTSLKGEYRLELQSADSVVIRFSMLGYRTKVRVLRKPRGKQTLQVVLYEDSKELQEVNVTAQKRGGTQTQNIDTEALKGLPSVTGNGVEELVQMQAGVSTHSELSSQYNVRGGAFDENSVYINNVEVFRPFLVRSGQQEGLSVINPDMVERIGFSTGGFEARYGDKMSSALDITYKKLRPVGKKTVAEGNISLSLLGASGYVGLGTKKLSWLNGLRYKTNSYLLGTLETKGEYKPSFLDYQTYLSYEPNTKWRIDFIGNISDNIYNFEPHDRETTFGTQEDVKSFRVYFDGKEKDLFRTFFGTFGVTHNLSANTSLSLIGSAFHTREQEKYDIQGQYWLTQTETSENLGVGTYFQHARNYLKANVQSLKLMGRHHNDHHDWEAAVTYKRERIEENSVEYEMRDSAGYSIPHTGRDLQMVYTMRAKNRIEANRIEAYVQDTWRFSGRPKIYNLGDSLNTTEERRTRYTLNYGVRMSHWNFTRETIVSPRVALAVTPSWNQNLMMRFATGLYYQAPFYKELRDTTTVSGITYARLNEKARSQRSIHFIGGLDYHFKMNERNFKFTGEIYYKMLGNLIPYSVNNVKVVYYGDNESSGHAAGIDLKLFGEFVPGTDSWLSFSFMNTRMKLNGKSIPLPTDQKYAVNLFFTDYFPGTTRWKMSLKLAYADGLPFSTPHRELETNSFRAPAYKRVDIGMAYRLINNEQRDKKMPFKNIWLSLDGLNLLGINNVNSYYWITDVTNHQYAVPNYLTGRQINFRVQFEF
ncbi:MAG: TonB-dependent receptor [Prevotella sp.]|nr:TonB-dependent receptor [Prevotella sp.]